MPLPAPNLDDRRFQQLVDDAKRLVQQRCPEWTDHNVSDPGVTLIETFAYMVDQLIYRLNRVPDRNFVKFLELVGVHLFPPTAAQADVTFWLSAPQDEPITVARGTQVASPRTETDEPVVFTTKDSLTIVPCELSRLASSVAADEVRDHTGAVGDGFYCFDQTPKADDTLLFGLSGAVPANAVLFRMDCDIEGVGVDPDDPPLVWEAWTGEGWAACEVDRDETGGLNRPGDLVVHIPHEHTVSVIGRRRAGWVRCRVVAPADGQPFYSASPLIRSVEAMTIGGTVAAAHAETVIEEIVGLSEFVHGQRFGLRRTPVVAGGDPVVVEVAAGDGWETWERVEGFENSEPNDRHFALDATSGELRFGPAVREADGSLRQYGAVPPKGAPIRIRSYRTGGGARGNVAAGRLTVLKSSIPYVARTENRHPATGGVDGEDIDSAKERGPITLRTRDRAVTAEDFEHLARQAAPEVGRVRSVTPGDEDAGTVRVLVVPAVRGEAGRLDFAHLVPDDDTLRRISDYLDERRTIGARVVVEPPGYVGVTVVARLRARPGASAPRLTDRALEALYRHFHPLEGGPDGDGWPFGRPVYVGEVYAVLQQVKGVELVEDVGLFEADPLTGERQEQTDRLVIGDHALVFSYQHQLRVEEP